MPLQGIPAVAGPGDVFALLDDAQARTDGRIDSAVSRLYTNFAHERTCHDPAELDAFWGGVEGDLALGLHAVFAIDYEWGVALQGASGTAGGVTASTSNRDGGAEMPGAFRVLLFRALDLLSERQVSAWLAQAEARALDRATPPTETENAPPTAATATALTDSMSSTAATLPTATSSSASTPLTPPSLPTPAPAGILDVQHSVTASEFDAAIAQIHGALARGDCYQINYTFRLTFGVFGHPLSLYRRIRERQPAGYGALISTADGWSLSASPELFVRHQAGRLLAQPMKGTAVRDSDPIRDAACGAALQADPKNRAENVMIVDLLRNDLSKLAIPGGVHVNKLFAVRAWPTLWQMISDVEATLRPNVRFPDVLRALYPCGSITGAPKHAAMGLIGELESTPRGLYTGAIGWFDQCGDFCLSVAIRTVTIETPAVAQPVAQPAAEPVAEPTSEPSDLVKLPGAPLAFGRAGIGAGIVLDSNATSEHEECLLKARFLTEADPGFALFETLLAEEAPLQSDVMLTRPRFHLPLRARHLRRLATASARLGFRCDLNAVNAALDQALLSISAPGAHRVRLTLSKQGDIDCGAWLMQPLRRNVEGAVTILLASDYGFGPIGLASPADAFLLGFKTTHRATYDRAWQTAERQAEPDNAFDMIFTNAAGNLTEGGRTNLLLKLDGAWFTPPVADGLLAGVMRSALMGDPQWEVRERHLNLNDLARAESIVVCNALRGALPARLRRHDG